MYVRVRKSHISLYCNASVSLCETFFGIQDRINFWQLGSGIERQGLVYTFGPVSSICMFDFVLSTCIPLKAILSHSPPVEFLHACAPGTEQKLTARLEEYVRKAALMWVHATLHIQNYG